MSKSSILLGISLSLCFLVPFKLFCQPIGTPISFNYTLNTDLRTSAGVYAPDSTLIRTLWNGEQKTAGTHIATWDGKNDDGNLMPDGPYRIQVMTNNMSYEWQGVVGNTSDSFTGPTVHHELQLPSAMVQVGTAMYYAAGYNETSDVHYKFNIGQPNQVKTTLRGGGICSRYMATDGNKVYYAGQFTTNEQGYFNLMHAITALDANPNGLDVLSTFSTGAPHTMVSGSYFVYSVFDKTFNKILPVDIYEQTGIFGLAVQRTGNYLFSAHRYEDSLKVFNKATGAFVRRIYIPAVREIAMQGDNVLWAVSGNKTVSKYTINSDGSLTAATLVLSGLSGPVAIAVSPDGTKVAIADTGASSHQVKIFNTSTGALSLIIGRDESYSNPTVYNDKFYFKNTKKFDENDYGQANCFLAYQSDGSIWIGDYGNSRCQHFSAAGVYIDNIQQMGYNYSIQVDANNPSRVWCGFLEFEIDYSKPLNPNNGSWKIKRNWSYNINAVTARVPTIFPGIATLNNGRTYTLGNAENGGDLQMIELDSVTGVRYIGNPVSYYHALQKDGSLWEYTFTGAFANGTGEWRKRALTAFDGNHNPMWAVPATISSLTYTNSLKLAVTPFYSFGQILDNGNIVHWYGGKNPEFYYHLAVIKPGADKVAWRASGQNHYNYQGEFPIDGTYDVGNFVQNPGNKARAIEKSIFWGYNGEFWKGKQTNYYNHYYENGLQLGQFGTNGIKAQELGEAVAENAGNAATFSVVKVGSNYYLYHADESQHGGVHRWKVSGLNTIAIQNIPVVKAGTPPAPVVDYFDLMAGLPFDDTLTNNTAGWTRFAPESNKFHIKTNHGTYKKTDQDLLIISQGQNVDCWVKRELGLNTGLLNWKITGELSFPEAGEYGDNFIEVLDNNDRIIVRISRPQILPNLLIKANSTNIASGNIYYHVGHLQPLSISVVANAVTVNYAGFNPVTVAPFDPQANATNPTTLRFYTVSHPSGHQVNAANLKFYKNLGLAPGHFRSKTTGLWKNTSTWQSSQDSTTWADATSVPDSNATSIVIQNNHTVTLTDTTSVDQLTIQNSGAFRIAPKALLTINNGAGDDVRIEGAGVMLIQSDATGTGRIGNSTGTVNGIVTVERYISSASNKAYRLLAPTVNTANGPKPFIRNNWQEGQNNMSILSNSNNTPNYGIHITGSMTGANGFDATLTGTGSLMYFNQAGANPAWLAAPNTNATNFDVKKGYLVYIRGDRSTDLQGNTNSGNTTLRTTGTLATGTQSFAAQEGNGRSSLVTNPYPCPIDWATLYNDPATGNAGNFESYYTYWDPNVGLSGGYVTVYANGTKSAATNATTEIQPGQAFFIKAKPGIVSPTFVVKESHKSGAGNLDVFRTGAREQFRTGLYFTDANGNRIMADGVNAVFDTSFSVGADGNDAEEMANWDENVAITRWDKMMSIEGRPLISTRDTIQLSVQRLRMQNYEWQFEPINFSYPGLRAFLEDKYTGLRTELSLSNVSVITFSVNMAAASSAPDRFRIVFGTNISLPIALGSVKAYQKGTGNQVEWTNSNETNVSRYEIEKSADGRSFVKAGTVVPNSSGSLNSTYGWFDALPITGNNYYRIKTLDKNGVATYSNIVNVKIGGKQEGFEIYPNPLTGNHITIQFVNMKKGDYTVNIINAIGQKVVSKRISHSGGSASQSLLLDASLPAGSYNLQITGFGSTINKKIIR